MAEKRNVLICYDITDPKRWRKVHKLLCAWALPVQYSVFEAELDSTQLARLMEQLQPCLKADTDKLTIYRLFKKNAKTHMAASTDDSLIYV
jgi:CRISPR-associated protein Cas2